MGRMAFLLLVVVCVLGSVGRSQAIQLQVVGQLRPIIAPAVDASGSKVIFGSAIEPDGTPSDVVDLYVINADGTGLRRLTRLGYPGVVQVSVTPDGTQATSACWWRPNRSSLW